MTLKRKALNDPICRDCERLLLKVAEIEEIKKRPLKSDLLLNKRPFRPRPTSSNSQFL